MEQKSERNRKQVALARGGWPVENASFNVQDRLKRRCWSRRSTVVLRLPARSVGATRQQNMCLSVCLSGIPELKHLKKKFFIHFTNQLKWIKSVFLTKIGKKRKLLVKVTGAMEKTVIRWSSASGRVFFFVFLSIERLDWTVFHWWIKLEYNLHAGTIQLQVQGVFLHRVPWFFF